MDEMSMTRIRELTIGDYDDMVRLWERGRIPFKPKGRDSREEIRRQMRKNAELFLGVFDERLLVGVVVGSHDGRKGWINRLAVSRECRRKGIAQLLLACVEKALRKRGARIFCALVEESNLESINLFRKQGYLIHRDILYLSKREGEDV
ncbi:MAG: GNAT family N-acetyltransferase [Candidatus Bathyarchaeota archaeon]|nr:MAG: GNAT family N-acetyltransferase [Candidatus Bathyarchaeota archaeon]